MPMFIYNYNKLYFLKFSIRKRSLH